MFGNGRMPSYRMQIYYIYSLWQKKSSVSFSSRMILINTRLSAKAYYPGIPLNRNKGDYTGTYCR